MLVHIVAFHVFGLQLVLNGIFVSHFNGCLAFYAKRPCIFALYRQESNMVGQETLLPVVQIIF